MTVPTDIRSRLAGLPGEEFAVPGIRDLQSGHFSPEALLLLIARQRLIEAGMTFLKGVAPLSGSPEFLLYEALEQRDSESAYGEYNSRKRRLDSFVRSFENRFPTTKNTDDT
ncbi:MAG: hypothetical protein ACKVHO_25995 [Verrucomicrobiia bacterium]|jgi:hypothetical protein